MNRYNIGIKDNELGIVLEERGDSIEALIENIKLRYERIICNIHKQKWRYI